MGNDAAVRRSLGGRRRTLAIVLSVVALSLGVITAHRARKRGSEQDPGRLGLLYEAVREFDARHEARAVELLDRRAAEVAPTSLDWMLRARIAEAQAKLAEALGFLRRIPDSDLIGAQARLKEGQVELARRHARAA